MQAKYGTGTVTFKNGKWLWVGYYKDENGKVKRPTKSFNTEAEALKFQAEQVTKTIIKKEMRTQDVTLETVFKLWLKETDVAESTKRNTLSNFNAHILPIIGQNKIKHLSIVTFSDYLKSLVANGKKEKTAYNIYTDLKTVVNFAIDEGIIYENPLEDMEIPKQSKPGRIVNNMTMDDYNKIMMCPQNQESFYYNCILFLGETGLRVSELAIKEEDLETVQLDDETITLIYLDKSIKRTLQGDFKTTKRMLLDQMKTEDSRRIIYLNGFALAAVENQLELKKKLNIKSPFIFTTSVGTLLEQRNVLRALHSFCVNAGIPKRGLHSLRKCFINRALQNGITPFDLAKYTGHSIQTMFNYYHNLNIRAGLKIINATERR